MSRNDTNRERFSSQKSKLEKEQPKLSSDDIVLAFSPIFLIAITSPLEVIKLRLQTQNEMLKKGTINKPYEGFIDCFKRTIREDESGIRALWKGNLVNMLRYFPNQMINFILMYNFQSRLSINANKHSKVSIMYWNLLAGGLSGIVSNIILYSLDVSRTKLSTDQRNPITKQKQFKGFFNVYAKSYREGGIRAIYSGFVISCFSSMIVRSFQLGLIEFINTEVISKDKSSNEYLAKVSLTISAITAVIEYPFDTIKRKMMVASVGPQPYLSSIKCSKQLMNREGAVGFYKGFFALLIKGFISLPATWIYTKLRIEVSKEKV